MQQHDVLPAAGYYPGLSSAAPDDCGTIIAEQYTGLICKIFQLDMADIKQVESYYFLIATPVEQLSVVQRLLHFDKPNSREIAIIQYLCHDKHGGIAFYRHHSSRMVILNCLSRLLRYQQYLIVH
tara:strand:+ start:12795 stop:13169 length:375 start_codon:yes stop_codon:yes gene_type:complete